MIIINLINGGLVVSGLSTLYEIIDAIVCVV